MKSFTKIVALFLLTQAKLYVLGDKSCSDRDILIDDLCYEPHFERATTFENAQEICKENGGQVALVPHTELQNSLTRIALMQKFDNYWIQASNKLMSSDSCHTIMYRNDYVVSEEHCNNGMFYICEFDFENNNSTRYGNKYYQFSEGRRKFTDALKACSQIGGKLAQVDEDVLNHLTTNLKQDLIWERFSDWQLDNLQFGYNPSIWKGQSLVNTNETLASSLGSLSKSLGCERFDRDIATIVDCDDYNLFVCQTTATVYTSSSPTDFLYECATALFFTAIPYFTLFYKLEKPSTK